MNDRETARFRESDKLRAWNSASIERAPQREKKPTGPAGGTPAKPQ
jgi:hypothetical protein